MGGLPLVQGPERAVAARGAWAAEDVYVAKLCFYETPFIFTVKLRFAGDGVSYDAELSVSFGTTRKPRLEGRAP